MPDAARAAIQVFEGIDHSVKPVMVPARCSVSGRSSAGVLMKPTEMPPQPSSSRLPATGKHSRPVRFLVDSEDPSPGGRARSISVSAAFDFAVVLAANLIIPRRRALYVPSWNEFNLSWRIADIYRILISKFSPPHSFSFVCVHQQTSPTAARAPMLTCSPGYSARFVAAADS